MHKQLGQECWLGKPAHCNIVSVGFWSRHGFGFSFLFFTNLSMCPYDYHNILLFGVFFVSRQLCSVSFSKVGDAFMLLSFIKTSEFPFWVNHKSVMPPFLTCPSILIKQCIIWLCTNFGDARNVGSGNNYCSDCFLIGLLALLVTTCLKC